MRYLNVTGSRNMWWGTVPSKTMNAVRFYLLLFRTVYINLQSSILKAKFLAEMISEINREY